MNCIKNNENRCRKLIEKAIENFSLSLADYTVLTEGASGYYMLTPMIAALAGAKKVYLITRDSRFGKSAMMKKEIMRLARDWRVWDRIHILQSRSDKRIREADIVTNLGFVRPINKIFISRLKPGVVIPLMWETWEYRPHDLDLSLCRKLNIPVLGTNEHHPFLRIFEYTGSVVSKLLFDFDIEIFLSRIAVIGDGRLTDHVKRTLESAGASVTSISSRKKHLSREDCNILRNADALVIAEHNNDKILIGREGMVGAKELCSLNPDIVIVHMCGTVDACALRAAGLKFTPQNIAPAKYMSVTMDYIGPKPLIDLHTAGFKVGEEMARARAVSSDGLDAELMVLRKTDLAQGFSGYHYGKNGSKR